MIRKTGYLVSLLMLAALAASCSPRIYGRLDLVDAGMRPVANDKAQGTVVNMMNTTAPLEKASHAAVVDAKGKFTSAKDAIVRGSGEAFRYPHGPAAGSWGVFDFERPAAGCRFAPRCPVFEAKGRPAVCTDPSSAPQLAAAGAAHRVACHFPLP